MKVYTMIPCHIPVKRAGRRRAERLQWMILEDGHMVAAYISETACRAVVSHKNSIERRQVGKA